MSKQCASGKGARAALLNGVNAVADPVKVTLGPRGRNVLIDRPGQPLATRDGVTVAREVSHLANPFENMGAAYAREVAGAAGDEAGDGTTTATVILQAIVKEGTKLVDAGAEPLLLADGIEAAAKACAETIKKLAIEATPELVRQAAIISTHGDVELGTMIAEATCKVGANGVLELQESRDENTTIEHLEGFYFDRGWKPYQFFAKDLTGQKCILDNPLILLSERVIVGSGVANGKVIAGDGLGAVLQACIVARRPLLIVAEDLAGDALNLFAANVQGGQIPGGCFVKLPGFGDQRTASLEDLRIAVGAKRTHSQTSTQVKDQLSSFTIEDLGWCARAVITPNRTVLIKGGAHEDALSRRVKQLSGQVKDATNPHDKAHLEGRIARLTGGVAVLRVGAHSEPAMIEKKARAEDAIHTCRGALQGGVVPGGGVALVRAAQDNGGVLFTGNGPAYVEGEALEVGGHPASEGDDAMKGRQLLLDAICEPAIQIIRNGGYADPEGHLNGVRVGGLEEKSYGYNSATGKFGDLYAMGVVDAAKVVLTALQKASSVGALLLTTEVLVSDIPMQAAVPVMPPGVLRG